MLCRDKSGADLESTYGSGQSGSGHWTSLFPHLTGSSLSQDTSVMKYSWRSKIRSVFLEIRAKMWINAQSQNVEESFKKIPGSWSRHRWLPKFNQLSLVHRCIDTLGPVSTEMGDHVRVQFPVPDIYFGMWPTSHPRPTQPSIPPGSVNEYQLQLGRQRQVWFILLAYECRVCR